MPGPPSSHPPIGARAHWTKNAAQPTRPKSNRQTPDNMHTKGSWTGPSYDGRPRTATRRPRPTRLVCVCVCVVCRRSTEFAEWSGGRWHFFWQGTKLFAPAEHPDGSSLCCAREPGDCEAKKIGPHFACQRAARLFGRSVDDETRLMEKGWKKERMRRNERGGKEKKKGRKKKKQGKKKARKKKNETCPQPGTLTYAHEQNVQLRTADLQSAVCRQGT